MIEYLIKKILLNTGFKVVEVVNNENRKDIIFNYEFVDDNGELDLREAKYKFNKVFELFKHDIKEIYDLTGFKHMFKIENDCFIISLVFN